MKRKPPYRDGLVHVVDERCDTCVFRPGNLMRLEPGRLRELTEHNRREGAALVCHKTTHGQDPQGEAICRGYFDAYADEVPLALAVATGIVREQTPSA